MSAKDVLQNEYVSVFASQKQFSELTAVKKS